MCPAGDRAAGRRDVVIALMQTDQKGPNAGAVQASSVQTAFTAMYKVMAGGKRAITGRSMRCVGDLLLSKKMMVLGEKKNKETIFWCGLSKGQQGVYFKKEIRKLQPLCFQV